MPSTNVAPRPAKAAPQRAAAPSRFTPAQVVGRAVTARDTVTFWLAAPGTTRAPAPYQPGQFITLALPDGSGGRGVIYRSYSLCGDGRADQPWEITVKRQQDGVGSGHLHDRVALGAMLPVSAPSGSFTLPPTLGPAMSLIFVAAGSGITPIYGMLRKLAAMPAARRPRVQLHYAYNDGPDAIYGDAINALDPKRTWLRQWRAVSAAGQRMTAAAVIAAAGDEAKAAQWFLCGPNDLMRSVGQAARQVGAAQERIHMERFYTPPTPGMRAAAGAASHGARAHRRDGRRPPDTGGRDPAGDAGTQRLCGGLQLPLWLLRNVPPAHDEWPRAQSRWPGADPPRSAGLATSRVVSRSRWAM